MRFGIALALICAVAVVLYVAPAFRQFAQQFPGYRTDGLSALGAPGDRESCRFHSAED